RDFFRVMGSLPQLGRIFSPAEETAGGPAVVLLGAGLWKRRFGADPGVVGKPVVLGGRTHTIIGVMPPFMFPRAADVFLPTVISPAGWKNRKDGAFAALARVRADVPREQAQAELDVISQRLAAQYPETNRDLRVHAVPLPAVFDMRAPVFALLAGM